MKIEILKEIIIKNSSKERFAVLTNIKNGNSEIFELGKPLSKEFINYKKDIENYYNLKKNGIINETQIFIDNHIKPIEVIIIGAVHITQYLIDFIKNLNFVITIIDPRKYFTSEQRFKNVKIIRAETIQHSHDLFTFPCNLLKFNFSSFQIVGLKKIENLNVATNKTR